MPLPLKPNDEESTVLKIFERPRPASARSVREKAPSTAAPRLTLSVSTSISSTAGATHDGGDFAESFDLQDGTTALGVWDAMGHGKPAVTGMIAMRAGLRAMLHADRDIVLTATALNRFLSRREQSRSPWPFVQAFFGVVDHDERSLRYAACGTDTALVFRANGDCEHLRSNGPLLGVDEGWVFREDTIALRSGDTVIVTTDGVTDARPLRSQSAFFGIDGVRGLYPFQSDGRTSEAETILSRVVDYSDGTLDDDAAVLVVRIS